MLDVCRISCYCVMLLQDDTCLGGLVMVLSNRDTCIVTSALQVCASCKLFSFNIYYYIQYSVKLSQLMNYLKSDALNLGPCVFFSQLLQYD